MSEPVITYKPIGVIRSEHDTVEKTPIQSAYAKGCKGRVEIFPEFAEGLQDLDGFSHGNVLHVDGADILDGTPLLDIKPYTARFDRIETNRNGWQEAVDEETARRRGRRGYDE